MKATVTIEADSPEELLSILQSLSQVKGLESLPDIEKGTAPATTIVGPPIMLCQSTNGTTTINMETPAAPPRSAAQVAARQEKPAKKKRVQHNLSHAPDPFKLVKEQGWVVLGIYSSGSGKDKHTRLHLRHPEQSRRYHSYRIRQEGSDVGLTAEQVQQIKEIAKNNKAIDQRKNRQKKVDAVSEPPTAPATAPSPQQPAKVQTAFSMDTAAKAALARTESDKQALLIGIVCNSCDGKVIREVKNYRFKQDDTKKGISEHYLKTGHTSYSSRRVA